MSKLSEAVNQIRAEFCDGCREQYTEEEIMNGKMCDGCEKAGEMGRTVANLQD